MSKIQKLELTWVGKNKQEEIEPRILVENPELSHIYETAANGQVKMINDDGTFDNMLIHGDNLLALKALEQDFAGKVKCIYIDPPYNTGSAFEHYDDNLEHSIWLNLMRARLEILKNLLKDDGLIFVQIDDNEQAYLTVIMDEIFGRQNRVNTICVKMSEPTGVKMTHADKRLPKLKEYILMYKKSDVILNQVKIPKEKWDSEYKLFLEGVSEENIKKIKDLMTAESVDDTTLTEIDNLLKTAKIINIEEAFRTNGISSPEEKESFRYKNAWRILRDVATTGGAKEIADTKRDIIRNDIFSIKTPQNKIYIIRNGYNRESPQPRIKLLFADDYLMYNPCDLWLDISTTGLENEGTVQFRNSKKPEKLVERCIKISTKEGDLVLDSFLGSGTTCAVAHKMKRKWIGIELGDHAYTLAKVRIDNVIDGTDQGGISKSVNWQGGGSYRFYELAPSLVVKDKYGKEIINPEYNANMLAAAMAKHEGFKYSPDKENVYKQGFASEKSFIFTTTTHLTAEYLDEIAGHFADDEFLVINCKSFDGNISNNYKNIKIKKIPQSILGKCVFGKDNYNLNIINLPTEEVADEEN